MKDLQKEYYIFSSHVNCNPPSYSSYFQNLTGKSALKSWMEGSALCESINGHLPYFTNFDEFAEIIKILRLSSEIPPIEAIFIGLWFNANKVCAIGSIIRQF